MSYDIYLNDPVTGQTIELDNAHQLTGGTYALGGTTEAWLNVTYNYGGHYRRVFPAPEGISEVEQSKGIRTIYGMTGAESIPILKAAADQLGDDVSDDYWESTEGNAKAALLKLIALAHLRPDGVWGGD